MTVGATVVDFRVVEEQRKKENRLAKGESSRKKSIGQIECHYPGVRKSEWWSGARLGLVREGGYKGGGGQAKGSGQCSTPSTKKKGPNSGNRKKKKRV